ncbi:hypothetical protein V5T82_01360 [Magnetovibrio sp. PR-2]|uniref:hypothetical protein n=1 Tax=Magnetovibrio sp. PR-2 TaxID=3120356 RepID=UPI002FCE53C8
MKYAIVLTVLYIVALISGLFCLNVVPSTANEWGDFLAGFVAPVALGWFIWTLALQRQELELQRKEMKLTRGVLEDQAEMQLKSAKAMLEANKIAASTLFAESVGRRENLFDQYIQVIGDVMPNLKSSTEDPAMDLGLGLIRPDSVSSAISYFDHLLTNGIGAEDQNLTDQQLAALKYYTHTFSRFRDEAYKNDRLMDVFGPYHDLWGKIRAFLGEEGVDY